MDSGFNLFTGAIGVPVVLLVLEGGPNTVRTMCELIKKKIPAVVVDGSGRAADVVAYAYSHTIKKWWAFIAIFVNPRVNTENLKNFQLALCAREKFWTRVVGKSGIVRYWERASQLLIDFILRSSNMFLRFLLLWLFFVYLHPPHAWCIPIPYFPYQSSHMVHLRDGPLENLWGGGRSTKKIFAQGKIKWKKKSCTPINPKKYSCYGLKKIHSRNLITTKNSCGSKIPLPPVTFLMVRPLVQLPL